MDIQNQQMNKPAFSYARAAACCAAVLVAGVVAPATAQCNDATQYTLHTQSPFGAGMGPSSVALGDLNGDFELDAIVTNQDDNSVSVLLGDGSGGFTIVLPNIPVGTSPSSVALGDLNGDSDPDIVVANAGSHDVSVLLSDGNGGFMMPPTNISLGTGTSPSSVALGHLNNDALLDIVVANQGDDSVSVLLGDVNGGFTAPTNIPLAFGSNPSSVALDDLNNDTFLDIVVANQGDNTVSVLEGDGNGNFSIAPRIISVGTSPSSVALGDLDNDSYPDIVVANQGSHNVSVIKNSNNGTFNLFDTITVGMGPSSVVLGDLDNDGDLDMVVALAGSGGVKVLLYDAYSYKDFMTENSFGAGIGTTPSNVALGDLDGVGGLDIVVANEGTDDMSVLLDSCSVECYGDFNGDGVVNFFDISAFIGAWFDANQSITELDANHDGFLDWFDITSFMSIFQNNTCP